MQALEYVGALWRIRLSRGRITPSASARRGRWRDTATMQSLTVSRDMGGNAGPGWTAHRTSANLGLLRDVSAEKGAILIRIVLIFLSDLG